MSSIDVITAILSIPGVEENGEIRNAMPGEDVLNAHFEQLQEKFDAMTARTDGQPSELDRLLSEFLGRTVFTDAAQFTYYEKKGVVYPALVMPADQILDEHGASQAPRITEVFREFEARHRLAELIGTSLGLDWVSIYTTFGPSA